MSQALSQPFQGITNLAQLEAANSSGQISDVSAAAIAQDMANRGVGGVPPVTLSAPSNGIAPLPSQSNVLGAINSIPGQDAQTIANAASSAQTQGCPAFSITDPIPWFQCEGLNLLLMFIGVAGIIIVFSSMFKGEAMSAAMDAVAA